MKRMAITAKDIQIIEGRSDRFGRNKIVEIKKALNKERHQLLTIEEYAIYAGIDVNQVLRFLNIHK
jgi:hypothetical protein